jgi:hypothetical protein
MVTLTAAFYAIVSLILVVSWTVRQPTHMSAVKEAAGLLLVPLVFFVLAWLFFYPFAALFCYLYNQVAKITGGIEFSIF